MGSSSSPNLGDRRARLAAERGGRPPARPGSEILDSRRSHRSESPRTGALDLLSTGALKIITGQRNRAVRKAEVHSAAERAGLTPTAQPRTAQPRTAQPRNQPSKASQARNLPARTSQARTSQARTSQARNLPARTSQARTSPSEATLAPSPGTGSSKIATPRTDALRLEHLRAAAIPIAEYSTGPLHLTDDDDTGGRGRRAARPEGARRRAELAVGRAVSQRRVWAVALAVTMVLLVPGTSVLSQKVTVAEGSLSGDSGRSRSLAQTPDAVRMVQPTTIAQTAAAQAKARTTTKTATAKHQGKVKAKRLPGLAAGSMAGLSDAASGLGWASGAFIPGSSPSKVAAFGAWRGAGMDLVTDWENRNSWDDIVNPAWLYKVWQGTPYTKVIGVAPIPEGDSSATMAGCAAGDYNDKWTQFGQNIKAAGLDDQTVIRLGWEFNGNWFKWQASDPAQFAECWRQIVGTVKQVAPKLTWDWNVNRGDGSASVADAREAYPGDAYVDVVGVDSYDMWPGAKTDADWQVQYAGPYGLKFWSDFATAHHKKFSVPEWGVYPGPASNGQSGGDNPFYIAKMEAFFKSEGSHLAFESYFNENASYYGGSIFAPTQDPAAAAKYKALVGG